MLIWLQTGTTRGMIGRLRVGTLVGSLWVEESGVSKEASLDVTIAGLSKRLPVS